VIYTPRWDRLALELVIYKLALPPIRPILDHLDQCKLYQLNWMSLAEKVVNFIGSLLIQHRYSIHSRRWLQVTGIVCKAYVLELLWLIVIYEVLQVALELTHSSASTCECKIRVWLSLEPRLLVDLRTFPLIISSTCCMVEQASQASFTRISCSNEQSTTHCYSYYIWMRLAAALHVVITTGHVAEQ